MSKTIIRIVSMFKWLKCSHLKEKIQININVQINFNVMKKFKYLFLSVIAILALDACKKDRTVVQTNNGGGNNSGPLAYELDFESLFSSKAPKTQYFTFDAATGSAMTTSSGSLYAIPAGSLLHQDNSPVTGNVDVKIIEY